MIEKSINKTRFTNHTYLSVVFLVLVILLAHSAKGQNNDDILNKKVSLKPQRTTVYQALNQISDSIGYFFAYDSRVVFSDRRIRINIARQPLNKALIEILNDSTLSFQVIDKHILIFRDKGIIDSNKGDSEKDQSGFISIKGRVIDTETRQPLPYATVGIPKLSLGNVTNLDGVFLLKIPKDLAITNVVVSHIGYKPKLVPINLLQYNLIDIHLETDLISIQEVIIRNIEPLSLVQEAIARIPDNFSNTPVYLKSFYREGVIKNGKYQNYSEAIFNIYKSPYNKTFDTDQVKLLKSRKTQNIDQTDTLSIKLRAGINGSLSIDIAKNLPMFLQCENFELYNFSRKDIITIGDRTVYVIAFTQKEEIIEALLNGVLFIDVETLAIMGAEFEVNQLYISRITDQYVYKKIRHYRIKPESIKYSVKYSNFNGTFYLAHARADLDFKYRKRRSLFYNPFHLFFEMVVSQIETNNVTRFDRKETNLKNTVFFDEAYEFDQIFWNDFNIIAPEQNVYDALYLINAKIEKIQ